MQSDNATPIIRAVTSAPFDENAYLVSLSGEKLGVVVDPGMDTEEILAAVDALGWTPAAILNTHGHADHIAGNGAMKSRWPDCPLIIGAGDAYKLTDPRGNLSADFGFGLVSPPADRLVREGEVLEYGGIRWTVYETPGHSRGHVVFVARELSPMIVLGGDMLFDGGVGRTDLADGSGRELVASIREKMFTLPDDAIVLPGHGPATTIGHERRTNPFVGERATKLGLLGLDDE